MHNIKSNFDKIFETIKSLPLNIFNDKGNIKRPGPIPKFSDLEVISLNIMSEYMSIDSENFLFKKIASCHRGDFPNIIERSQYNKRKKNLFLYIDQIRAFLANQFVEFEDYFVIDSMPLEVCKIAREKRAKICKEASVILKNSLQKKLLILWTLFRKAERNGCWISFLLRPSGQEGLKIIKFGKMTIMP